MEDNYIRILDISYYDDTPIDIAISEIKAGYGLSEKISLDNDDIDADILHIKYRNTGLMILIDLLVKQILNMKEKLNEYEKQVTEIKTTNKEIMDMIRNHQ